jgi:hypothetical protein
LKIEKKEKDQSLEVKSHQRKTVTKHTTQTMMKTYGDTNVSNCPMFTSYISKKQVCASLPIIQAKVEQRATPNIAAVAWDSMTWRFERMR